MSCSSSSPIYICICIGVSLTTSIYSPFLSQGILRILQKLEASICPYTLSSLAHYVVELNSITVYHNINLPTTIIYHIFPLYTGCIKKRTTSSLLAILLSSNTKFTSFSLSHSLLLCHLYGLGYLLFLANSSSCFAYRLF